MTRSDATNVKSAETADAVAAALRSFDATGSFDPRGEPVGSGIFGTQELGGSEEEPEGSEIFGTQELAVLFEDIGRL